MYVSDPEPPELHLFNNIFSNTQGGVTSVSHKMVAIGLAYTSDTGAYMHLLSDNNDLYSAGTSSGQYSIGLTGGPAGNVHPALEHWQSETGTDMQSVSVLPGFMSTTDMHLDTLSLDNYFNLYQAGVPVSIDDDFDCEPRDEENPVIGADEYVVTECDLVEGGTITPASYTHCHGISISLEAQGATVILGVAYQWKVSATSGSGYENVTGGNGAQTTNYSTGVLDPGTYYFIMETSCFFSEESVFSNEVTVTIYPFPSAEIMPSGNQEACAELLLTATSDAQDPQYQWIRNSSLLHGETSEQYLVLKNDQYRISVTEAVTGCASVSDFVSVIIHPKPVEIEVDPEHTITCPGLVLPLSVTAVSHGSLIDEDVNIVFPSLTNWLQSHSSTGGNVEASRWSIYHSTPSIKSPDSTQFGMTSNVAQGPNTTTNTTLRAPVVSTLNYHTLRLSYWHHYRYNANPDHAFIEVSTDNNNWTMVKSYTSTQGSETEFVFDEVNLDDFTGFPELHIRFRYVAFNSYYWAMDDYRLTGAQLSSFTWSPHTDLFLDEDATTPYEGTFADMLFTMPAAPVTYTITAASASGCVDSMSIDVLIEDNTEVISQIDHTYGSLRSILKCIMPSDVITYNVAMADTSYMDAPLLIDKHVAIIGSSDHSVLIHFDFTKPAMTEAGYGLGIADNVEADLGYISVWQNANTDESPVLLNEGILRLLEVMITGSSEAFCRNLPGSTLVIAEGGAMIGGGE